jgi:hypothetical protein
MVAAFLLFPLVLLGMAAEFSRSSAVRTPAFAGVVLVVGAFLFLVQPWLWFLTFSEFVTWCLRGSS